MASSQQKPSIDIAGLNKDIAIPGLACRHCLFFRKEGLYEDEKDKVRERTPCKNLNVLPTSKPCPNFSVAPEEFNFTDVEDPTVLLAQLLSGLDEKRLPQFAAHLVELYKTRKKGYRFGETVYVRLFGDEYLSNYAAVKVVKAKEITEKLYQTSSLDPQVGRQLVRQRRLVLYLQGHGNMRLRLYDTHVLREKEFAARIKDLQARKRLADPKYSTYTFLPVPSGLEDPAYRPKLAQVVQPTKAGRVIKSNSKKTVTDPGAADTLPSGRQRRNYEKRRFTATGTQGAAAYRVSGKGLNG